MEDGQKTNDGALRSGLRVGDRQVPLEGVRIEAQLAGFSTKVTVTQRYCNAEKVPLEAVYVFPLDESAAVCAFEACVGGKRIVGRVEERETAFEAYDDAMEDGHGAFLLDQERPNVFTASIGNLLPGETVDIMISYVSLARREGAAARLTIPTTVSPRYVPPDAPRVGQPDGERVNPERRFEVGYGLTLGVDVIGSIVTIDSPSHAIKTTLTSEPESPGNRGARVELSASDVALDRDFVLLVESLEPHRPSARVFTTDEGQRFCQVSFNPEFEAARSSGSEVTFVLDCSGSMMGDSIDQAKRALALCLRALEEGDTFNIVRFGSRFETMWSEPRTYTAVTLDVATSYVDAVAADLGGTEILPALKSVLEQRPEMRRPRQILLLTDGEVSNEKEVIDLARKHAGAVKVFTFGIGAGASEYLVRGIARASRGAAEMIFPGERIEPKVLRMFARVRTPAVDHVSLSWIGLDVDQHPAKIPPVFAGDALTVFAHVKAGDGNEVRLSAGERSWTLALESVESGAGSVIPSLWAREAIRDIETGADRRHGSSQRPTERESRRRARLVELGQSFGLLSSMTSYVAIEERTEADKSAEAAQLRRIPVALTVGWGGYGTIGGGVRSLAVSVSPTTTGMLQIASAPRRSRRGARSLRGSFRSLGELAKESFDSVFEGTRASASSGPIGIDLSTEEAASSVDRLYELLLTQNADGSFPPSQALDRWLGPRAADRVGGQASVYDLCVLITAVVVALIERDEASREDEWRLAIGKARKWLEQHGTLSDAAALIAVDNERSATATD